MIDVKSDFNHKIRFAEYFCVKSEYSSCFLQRIIELVPVQIPFKKIQKHIKNSYWNKHKKEEEIKMKEDIQK